jgi:two-component system, NarL family, nitrate/nitrite response regulator NarL
MTSLHPRPIRLLLVDDHTLVRAALRMLLESHPRFCIVGEAAEERTALPLAASEQPDVILLDLSLGECNGAQLIPALREAAPHAQVLVLTGIPTLDAHLEALRLGAKGLVSKDQSADTLLTAIEKVHAGQASVEPALLTALLNGLSPHHKEKPTHPEEAKITTLSPREREVIVLLGQGPRNREIATRLFISETTVRHHLTSIFNKLQVADRLELVIYAYRYGLAPLPA